MPKHNKRRIEVHLIYEHLKGVDKNVCYYCGIPADTDDHAVPITCSLRAVLPVPVVPACRWCNSTLNDSVFLTLFERREYVKGKLAEKHKNLLGRSRWTKEELQELGKGLRKAFEGYEALREQVIQRLAFSPQGWQDRDFILLLE